jgi:hypothetical protein
VKSSRWFAQLLVSAATAALAVGVAGVAGVGPANAAPVRVGAAAPHTAVVITASTAGPAASSATVHCKTDSLKGNVVSEPGGWPILAWFEQTTYWCYDGTVVTSHKTSYRAGITGAGTLAGLSYTGIVAGTEGWHCYVAAGSHRNCSGNTEYAEGGFQSCVPHVNCESSYVYLQSWENYKGDYLHN